MTVNPDPRRSRGIDAALHAVFKTVAIAVGVVMLLQVMMIGIGIFGAPLNCQNAVEVHNPEVLAHAKLYRRTWGRTLEGHYVAGALLQSSDISEPPSTIICQFKGYEWAFDSIQVYPGDQLGRLIAASLSNWNPTTWQPLFRSHSTP